MNRRYLFLFLGIFLLIDLVLFIFFINKRSLTTKPKKSEGEIYIPEGKTLTVEGQRKGAVVEGKITGSAFFQDREVFFPLEIASNNTTYKIVASLGDKEKSFISISEAEKNTSNVYSARTWNIKQVSNILRLIKPNVYIQLQFFLEPISGDIVNNPKCTDLCQARASYIKQYASINNQFANDLENSKLSQNEYRIGGISSIVFFIQ